ncbi:hypothetical protein ACFV16_22200 [Streptomyces massasporeus]|uniref:hypothetical protein n=1 Tax=Streptomyces massasporeus TaxID=67324 RepID=UPI003681C177
MAVDLLSRRALLEMKRGNGVAPRHRVWPPEGYVAPTADGFTELHSRLRNKSVYVITRGAWEKWPDDRIVREMQLLEIAPYREWGLETAAYAWSHSLRNEMSRRKLVHRSIRLHRCEACSHATERLFEVTQETHPGLENRSGDPVASAWFCARCWSGDDVADEGEAEDEE